jgi:hypothetical protein
MDKREFRIIEDGTTYELDNWRVIDGEGIKKVSDCACGTDDVCSNCGAEVNTKIQFVRGSKLAEEDVEKKDGVLHETLLSMMIHDMKFKNSLVPSRESSLAITKLEEALMWMEERQRNRQKAGVVGTYKKH